MSQRQIRNVGRSCQTIASFLLKTYQILDHPQFQHIISWDKDNIGFIVKDVVAFTREILPKYFRHSNFSSFVRQLNMYDFHKVKQDNDNLVFKNPLFKKGQQQQLREIRRKASKRPFSNSRPSNHHSKGHNNQSQKFLNTLKSLKKVVESQMNNSCANFQHGLKVLDQANSSNNIKLKYLKNLQEKPENCLDNIFKLKQQCFSYFNKIQSWINENLENSGRKLKSVSGFISQLQKKDNRQKQKYKQSNTLISLSKQQITQKQDQKQQQEKQSQQKNNISALLQNNLSFVNHEKQEEIMKQKIDNE